MAVEGKRGGFVFQDIKEGQPVARPLSSSSPLPPSPPAEKATAGQEQAGQSSTGDGAGDTTDRSR
jgi:hypothetical protein